MKHWTQSHHQNDLPFLYKAFVVFSHVVWPHRQSCFTAHHLEGSRPSMVSSQPQADQWFGDVRSTSLVKSGSFGQLRSMHTLARFWSLLLLCNPGSTGSRVRLSVLSTPPSVHILRVANIIWVLPNAGIICSPLHFRHKGSPIIWFYSPPWFLQTIFQTIAKCRLLECLLPCRNYVCNVTESLVHHLWSPWTHAMTFWGTAAKFLLNAFEKPGRAI